MATPPPTPLHVACIADSELFGNTCAEPARQRLLLAGLKLFADQGYAKTSIRQIAVEAGTNVAAISYYFGGKAELYRAVFWCGKTPPTGAAVAPQSSHGDMLDDLFERLLEPLRLGKAARSWMKLQRREMLEPTGLGQEKMDRGMAPVHASLVAYLCGRLGLARSDDEVHALAQLVVGPAVHLLVNCEVVDVLAPTLLDGDAAIDAWRERLRRAAEAVIEAERLRRLAATARTAVNAPEPAPPRKRISRSKA